MTGIRPYNSCRRDLHVLDPEADLDLGGNGRAVLEIDEVDAGVRGGRTSGRSGLLRAGLNSSVHGHSNKNDQAEACKSIHGQLPRYANMGPGDQQVGAGNPDRCVTEPSCSSGAIPKAPTRADRSRPHERGSYIEIRLQSAYSAAIMRIDAAVRCFAVGLVVAFGLLAEARAAEPRVALVIGNGAYRSVPELENSRNDADDISEQLKRVGFAVIDGRDLDRSAMYAALGRFAQRVSGTDAGLVYYSGHGMQINGQNYLAPVDLKRRQEARLRRSIWSSSTMSSRRSTIPRASSSWCWTPAGTILLRTACRKTRPVAAGPRAGWPRSSVRREC